MLIINNDLVTRLLTMKECIEAQESSSGQLPSGGSNHRPRRDMYLPCQHDDGCFRWGTMEGANNGFFAIRMKSDIVHWPRGARATTRSPFIATSGTRDCNSPR